MNLGLLAARNVLRNRTRTSLTILGSAIAIVTFVLLRTVLTAWYVGIEYAAQDRLVTRHRVSFTMVMPHRYADDVRQVPGVTKATGCIWFGARDPKNPKYFFANLACEPNVFEVYDEMVLEPSVLAAWKSNRRGVIIGDLLAHDLNLQVGSHVTLQGTIYPGDWELEIVGIYKPARRSIDRSQFILHYEYVNDAVPEARKDQIGWVVSRVADGGRGADVARAIDAVFDSRDTQTLSQTEKQFGLSFLASFQALLTLLDVVSACILLIMGLIMGNTIAMGVRERTSEYGVLRAIGFRASHIAGFVLGEAAVLGVLGGLAGIALSYPLVEWGIGRMLEEHMPQYFPYFRIEPKTIALSLGLSMLLALLASIIPARQAVRLRVTEALRRTL